MSVPDMHGGGARPPGRRSRRFLRSKRTWVVLVAAALGISIAIPAASFADSPSGCDFSPANNGTPGCLGALDGSTFAGGDGNLQTSPTTFGSTDWQNVSGLNPGFDLPSGTGDNSFGQGTKEDDPNVSVVSGSIPPNKSNLTRSTRPRSSPRPTTTTSCISPGSAPTCSARRTSTSRSTRRSSRT
jgi:hypothetical protein